MIKITAADSGAWHTGAGLITAIYWEMTMTDATLSELSAHLNQEPVPRAESESIDYEHEPSRRCVGCRDTLQGQRRFRCRSKTCRISGMCRHRSASHRQSARPWAYNSTS